MSENQTISIQLPSGALAGWPVLVNALKEAADKTGYHMIFGGLVEQIQAQTTPPKPDEPLGLGAVVEDVAGHRWILVFQKGMWQREDDRDVWRTWEAVMAVRVLSEGVQL